MDIKMALKDPIFRDSLPSELTSDIQKYLQNPGCACNLPIYQKIMKVAQMQLASYFPNKIIVTVEEEMQTLSKNNWTVINCHINEVQEKLKQLGPGRKQIALSRFEDQATVIINELDFVY